jgi:hypothetical protein
MLKILNAYFRRFKGYEDIATSIMKSAPDYSSVYVIAKGKVVETRPAVSPLDNLDVKSPGMSACKSENDIRYLYNVEMNEKYRFIIFKG